MDIIEILTRLVFVSMLAFVVNIPLGIWRSKTKKFSLTWFISVHLAVPFIYLMRVENGLAYWSIIILVIFSILGQLAGGVMSKKLMKNRAILCKHS